MDSRRTKAEDIKGADEKTTTMMHEFFNLIITWKKALITVIYKKGDVTNPENYRPICGLRQLYKLFSTMLCNRLFAVLDRGTKQFDPLSSLLLNSVLQSAMEKDIESWKGKGSGIKLSDETRDSISYQRFADDVLMMASSKKQLKK